MSPAAPNEVRREPPAAPDRYPDATPTLAMTCYCNSVPRRRQTTPLHRTAFAVRCASHCHTLSFPSPQTGRHNAPAPKQDQHRRGIPITRNLASHRPFTDRWKRLPDGPEKCLPLGLTRGGGHRFSERESCSRNTDSKKRHRGLGPTSRFIDQRAIILSHLFMRATGADHPISMGLRWPDTGS
jgi:hypothetical protein